jgi:CPA1 family monovalent cation:H+ antiporter
MPRAEFRLGREGIEMGSCEHLAAAGEAKPERLDACTECEKQGTNWVHLRVCLTCGNVACCDSSPWRHATKHFEDTGHPVMQSAQPGEAWRWCYVDELLG